MNRDVGKIHGPRLLPTFLFSMYIVLFEEWDKRKVFHVTVDSAYMDIPRKALTFLNWYPIILWIKLERF